MAENRIDRELTTREKTARKRNWAPPELLPVPKPEEGYTYHWVRVATRGEADPMNVSSKLREGWEPVRAVDHPEIFVAGGESDRFKDNVIIGGLMLCKAPVEMVEDRNAFYNEQADAQANSVDNNFMRESDPRMPLFTEKRSKVTFGTGN
ncbi:MAG: hypothetical protein EBR82_31055 [Caulobacteraceae bacterium]|nr:hypothetical protein [Caulobacteraceae bacterium]